MHGIAFQMDPRIHFCPYCGTGFDEKYDGTTQRACHHGQPQGTRRSIWQVLWCVALVGTIASCVIYSESKLPDRKTVDAKIKEAEDILATLSYPGANNGEVILLRKVYCAERHFYSFDNYEKVKQHYLDLLTPMGWACVDEHKIYDWWRDLGGRSITLAKGEFRIELFYFGDKDGSGTHYAIGAKWNAPQKD
jgi:hypothetical protein